MARSGDLQVIKECSEYTGGAGDFCTITSSNLEEIEAGAKVIYAEAAGEGTLDTDVVLLGELAFAPFDRFEARSTSLTAGQRGTVNPATRRVSPRQALVSKREPPPCQAS